MGAGGADLMTATSSTGYTPANQDLAQGKCIIPIQVLIVAELATCRETIRALLELQDLGRIQIIGRVESGVEALQAMMVLLPDLIILDHRQDVGSLPLSSVLASNFPAIKLLCFAEGNSARPTKASLSCRVQALFSKATLRADLVAALERISGSIVKQPTSRT
jgi:DNA-binding NarL/FixJ family response regulator